jgi:hypothetical protein
MARMVRVVARKEDWMPAFSRDMHNYMENPSEVDLEKPEACWYINKALGSSISRS